MDENLELGEVQTIYSDFMNKIPKEMTIQLTDTEALRFTLNKENDCVDMVYMNTLFDEPDKKSQISKEDFIKMHKCESGMIAQFK